MAGAAVFAAFFAAVPAANRARCLVAKSFEGAAGFEIGGCVDNVGFDAACPEPARHAAGLPMRNGGRAGSGGADPAGGTRAR